MKINDSNLNSVTSASHQAGQTQGTGGNAKAGGVAHPDSRTDRVQLSDLSGAIHALSSGSPAREARISHLAGVYQSGKYHADANAVSKQLIQDATTQTK